MVLALVPAATMPAPARDVGLLPEVLGATERMASEAGSGLAIAGYDPVSYRLAAAPVLGAPDVTLVRDGLVWHFSGAANRAAFARDPESFRPRLGGYDAAGVAAGRLVGADPTLFLLRDGGLYLFRDPTARERFRADPAASGRAEANWTALRDGLVGE